MAAKLFLQLVLVCIVSSPVMTDPFFGFRNLSDESILSLIFGDANCPLDCTCGRTSISNFVRDISGRIGPLMRQVMDVAIYNLYLRNTGLKLYKYSRYRIFTNLTCQVRSKNSVESIVSKASGVLFIATFVCGENVTLNFDAYTRVFVSLNIDGCKVSTASERFTFPTNNTLMHLRINNIKGDWLNKLSLENLQKLLVLDLTNCTLKTLPVIWTNVSLPKLKFLDLRHNDLQKLDCEFGQNAIKLLENNIFASRPQCAALLWSYVQMLFRGNKELLRQKINKMKSTFLAQPNLTDVSDISQYFYANMTILDLSYSGFTNVTASTFQTVDKNDILETLNLSYNQITSIEYGSLDVFPVLSYIDLSHNLLKKFDHEFSPVFMYLSVTIDLRHNRMKYPPFHSMSYDGPHSITAMAAWNPFSCDCSILEFIPFYRKLAASSSNLSDAKQQLTRFNAASRFMDATEYLCDAPYYLTGERVLDLSEGHISACPVVDNCPLACRCSRVNDHVTVNCEDARLESLPNQLPSAKALSINLRNNSIKVVDYRQYFNRTKDIDLSYNEIANVTNSGIDALITRIPKIQLHSNRLSRLPDSSKNLRVDNIVFLTLHDNPWQCSCKTVWMTAWLHSMGDHLSRISDIECVNDPFKGIPVVDVNGADMHCESPSYITTAIALAITFAILILLVVLVIVYRLEIKVLLYARFQWPILKKNNEAGNLPYDVFLSFSQHDYKWIVHTLTPYLENRNPPYKLCIHDRDFPVGEPIAESISRAIQESRCTLMYVTNAFLRSEWCIYEFKTAHQHLLETGDSKVVMILQENVDTRGLDKTLAAYVKTHSYIRFRDKLFWEKLLYALPKIPEEIRV